MRVAQTSKGRYCPSCLHISTTKGNLKAHILSGKHKLPEKAFRCHFCQKHYSMRPGGKRRSGESFVADGIAAAFVGTLPHAEYFCLGFESTSFAGLPLPPMPPIPMGVDLTKVEEALC